MNEVEIEFAIDMRPDGRLGFTLLQVRPICDYGSQAELNFDDVEASLDTRLVKSKAALGNGLIDGIERIVYVPEDRFDCLKSMDIAAEVSKINVQMRNEDKGYLLIGPGRWGSSVPSLGIPVMWSDISDVKMIVECGIEGLQVEPSQGTHFFQNITSLGVGYLTVDEYAGSGSVNFEALSSLECVYEGQWARVYKVPGLTGYIDRDRGMAVIGL